ncbi:hypothetical protein DA2_0961 [Desulfovibrio sp. A2]|nr:hypothetical protein DA2_0961 [Desulfovibrio sp. A2]
MFELIIENAEWIFSGIGVSIIFSIFKVIQPRCGIQKTTSGSNSINIQAGKDVIIKNGDFHVKK